MPPTRTAWRDGLRRSSLPKAERAVAQALAAYWPAQTTLPLLWSPVPQLAADTGYSERHVKRALTALQATGWLVCTDKARQHRAPRYAPVIPIGAADLDTGTGSAATGPTAPNDPSQGGRHVTPGPVDNHSQRGHRVTSGENPGVTSTTARGDMVSPDPEDPEVRTPLPPAVHSGTAATAGDTTGRGNYPQHIHEANAVKALAGWVTAGRLPLDVTELLEHAYRAGHGDPWAGYLAIKPYLARTLDDVRDPRAVLLARLTNLRSA